MTRLRFEPLSARLNVVKQTSVLFRSIAVAAAVMFAASPAAAHEGAIGEGGPIVVRVDTGFGDSVDGR